MVAFSNLGNAARPNVVKRSKAPRLTSAQLLTGADATKRLLDKVADARDGEPVGCEVVDIGMQFCSDIRARGNVKQAMPVDKAFRDALYDDEHE